MASISSSIGRCGGAFIKLPPQRVTGKRVPPECSSIQKRNCSIRAYPIRLDRPQQSFESQRLRRVDSAYWDRLLAK